MNCGTSTNSQGEVGEVLMIHSKKPSRWSEDKSSTSCRMIGLICPRTSDGFRLCASSSVLKERDGNDDFNGSKPCHDQERSLEGRKKNSVKSTKAKDRIIDNDNAV